MIGGRSALLGASGINPYGNWAGNYSDVSLLLRGNTGPGPLAPADESPTLKTLTLVGNAGISTTIFKYGNSSIEFDGTDDRITLASSSDFAFGTGNFTIEFWIYSRDVSTPAQRAITQISSVAGGLSSDYSTGVMIYQGRGLTGGTNGGLAFFVGSTFVGANAGMAEGQWHHIALTRSGTALYLFFNGNLISSATNSTNITASNLVVGGGIGTGSLYNGFIDDFRITKGIARYVEGTGVNAGKMVFTGTNNLALPTAQLPANVTDDPGYNSVSLLLRGNTGPGPLVPTDESPTLKTITASGGASASTTTFKYGGSALSFNGSGGLSAAYDTSLDLAGGNFTIEAWVKFGASVPNSTGVTLVSRYTSTARSYLFFAYVSAGNFNLYFDWTTNNSTRRVASASIPTPNTSDFYHYAVVRSGEQILFFANGQQRSLSLTPSTPLGTFFNQPTPLEVGTANALFGTDSGAFNGNIDDLRITKGVARYTKNFLPPPAQLPAI